MHSSSDCSSCACVLVASCSPRKRSQPILSFCDTNSVLLYEGITNPDYRMPMRIRPISFSFSVLALYQVCSYSSNRPALLAVHPGPTGPRFSIPATMIHQPFNTFLPFLPLHCAMTAVQLYSSQRAPPTHCVWAVLCGRTGRQRAFTKHQHHLTDTKRHKPVTHHTDTINDSKTNNNTNKHPLPHQSRLAHGKAQNQPQQANQIDLIL